MVTDYGKEGLATVTNMRESIQMIKNQDMEFLHGPAEMFTKEIMKMILEMGMEKCTGMMEAFTKGSGKMEFSMEKDKYMCLDQGIRRELLRIMCLS